VNHFINQERDRKHREKHINLQNKQLVSQQIEEKKGDRLLQHKMNDNEKIWNKNILKQQIMLDPILAQEMVRCTAD